MMSQGEGGGGGVEGVFGGRLKSWNKLHFSGCLFILYETKGAKFYTSRKRGSFETCIF